VKRLEGRKLGILLSTAPDRHPFGVAVSIAKTALAMGCDVYAYCIDDATAGVADERLQALRMNGLKLYACAYGAQRRGLPMDDRAVYAGLTVVSDLIASTDRFISFN
jgi:predicted peroxiredoxin